jgi:hypothetical protein
MILISRVRLRCIVIDLGLTTWGGDGAGRRGAAARGVGRRARTGTGGPHVRTRADSAEGRSVAEAGDIYVVDRRPRRAMITDELSMRVDRAVGSVDYLYKRILLDVFVHG